MNRESAARSRPVREIKALPPLVHVRSDDARKTHEAPRCAPFPAPVAHRFGVVEQQVRLRVHESRKSPCSPPVLDRPENVHFCLLFRLAGNARRRGHRETNRGDDREHGYGLLLHARSIGACDGQP